MNYITFDIETYNPVDFDRFDVNQMRASVIGAYLSWENRYIAFLEEEVSKFIELCTQVDLVIGYNHIHFDHAVLQKYTDHNLRALPNYDIMVEIQNKIGFRLKLDDVCKANLEADTKTDKWEKFKFYHRDGKWLELIDYCLNDVRLTEEIFRKILHNQTLNYYDLHQKKEVIVKKPEPGKFVKQVMSQSIF